MRRSVVIAAFLMSPLNVKSSAPPGSNSSSSVAQSCELATSSPAVEGVDAERLHELVDSARATLTDAFVVLKNGRIVAEWYSDSLRGPIQTMSATKSIVSLAIGQLLHAGRLDSLDQPVWTLYPEWRQGRKQHITLRHLLNQTSGLQDVPSDAPEIAPAPDAVALALAAELMASPGEFWFYSNKATNLLAGIVERASGKPLDAYIAESLLAPLCARDATWQFRDASGNPYAMAGLALSARDLAKVGQVMLDGGEWRGTRLVPHSWVAQSSTASQPLEPRYGLMWWIHPEWARTTLDSSLISAWSSAGVPRELVEAARPLIGRHLQSADWRSALDSVLGEAPASGRGMQRLAEATRSRGVPMRRMVVGPAHGYYANGSLGQWLFVMPAERIVVVRQIRRRAGHREADNFSNLPALARKLLGGEQ